MKKKKKQIHTERLTLFGNDPEKVISAFMRVPLRKVQKREEKEKKNKV
jgi:hypothetical protein